MQVQVAITVRAQIATFTALDNGTCFPVIVITACRLYKELNNKSNDLNQVD